MRFRNSSAGAAVAIIFIAGCQSGNPKAEPFGKTYYLDGAGNLGFGTAQVPRGLQKAGYKGDVEVFIWTISLNPLIDQLNLDTEHLPEPHSFSFVMPAIES